MIHMQRKLKARFTGDPKYIPEGIEAGRWMPVIGYKTKMEKRNQGGHVFDSEEILFLFTGSKGRIVMVAAHNMQVMIDEGAELNFSHAMQLMNNITIIGKNLCEQFNKIITGNCTQQGDRKDGKESK